MKQSIRVQPTRRQVLAALGATVLSGCTDSADGSQDRERVEQSIDGRWPMARYDPANTGYNPMANGPRESAQVSWKSYVTGSIKAAPAVVGETIFTGAGKEALAIDRQTGQIQWKLQVNSYMTQFSPVVAGDRVFFAGRDGANGTLYAIHRSNGEIIWQQDMNIQQSPVVSGKTLYLGEIRDQRGYIRALDIETGTEHWAFEVSTDEVTACPTPAVADGTVYAAMTAHEKTNKSLLRVYAIDIETGKRDWQFETPGDAVALACADETVYVSNRSGAIFTVEMATGTERWAFETSYSIDVAPAVANGSVYVCDRRGTVYAVDSKSGEEHWHVVTHAGTDPVVANDVVYIGGRTALALDASNGTTLWKITESGFSVTLHAPIVVNNAVYTTACIKKHRGDIYDNYVYELLSESEISNGMTSNST